MASDLAGCPLVFHMMAWLLMEQEASARGMSLDIVARQGTAVGIMLGRHRQRLGNLAYLVFRELASARGVAMDKLLC